VIVASNAKGLPLPNITYSFGLSSGNTAVAGLYQYIHSMNHKADCNIELCYLGATWDREHYTEAEGKLDAKCEA
jgi:hypothetical protein